MFRHARLFALALVVVALPSSTAGAQDAAAPADTAVVTESPVSVAGPTLAASTLGVRATTEAPAESMTMQRRASSKPVALMIVGGAAIVLGAVIGDAPGTLFMIGGAVALLYGLYQYLQ